MLLMTASACTLAADDAPTEFVQPSPSGAQTPKQDPNAFCYIADQAYSEGAVIGEQVCARQRSNNDLTKPIPLRWYDKLQLRSGR
jgi:Protein of unknown function (DUF1496)